MVEKSVKYTAFIIPFGQYKFTRMLFGLKPAPTRFQKFVNEILDKLICAGEVIVYIDDFLVATEFLESFSGITESF